ncbi:ectoine/hydroxyectoine ABC transporter substrate-binding protein EhuB [Paenibacillus sp. S3N08]|uniref:Ectoine/hydroxyectoine ABC transporter substrate-binding protein EhuB n=2 Tax=Paenibacillus agricola TaxID=2716264 RepID=A0ABX0J9X8_9BACL|nr:ectoine/hydroxyectoine ABC transporter substrate-binding protein EhuB [Paenibacillus agricola]
MLSLTLLGAVMAGCATQPADVLRVANETSFEKVKRQGYVSVGFANEKPYAYATPDGKLTGEAVEVARTILKKLGINQMDGVLTEFGSLIPGLKAKRFDIITAGMFINPERSKEVAFANPEYSIGEALAVKKGNPLKLHSYKDISTNNKARVAVMVGAIEKDYLTKSGVPEVQIITVPDQPSAISALQAGRADAITMTGPSLQAVLESAKDAGIERVMNFEQPVIDGKSMKGYGAAAFRIEDKDFREAYNQELEKMKSSGELLTILKSFGFTEQELPGDMKAEQLAK